MIADSGELRALLDITVGRDLQPLHPGPAMTHHAIAEIIRYVPEIKIGVADVFEHRLQTQQFRDNPAKLLQSFLSYHPLIVVFLERAVRGIRNRDAPLLCAICDRQDLVQIRFHDDSVEREPVAHGRKIRYHLRQMFVEPLDLARLVVLFIQIIERNGDVIDACAHQIFCGLFV